jgi:lysosomal Pro-X carboxypeptidase
MLIQLVLSLLGIAALVRADCGLFPSPGVNNCTEMYFTQYIDHFSWGTATFQQRYYVYDKFYAPGGPILFYTGNEADVEVFANCTGLMWSSGPVLHGLLVFAEHRYFGKSLPCPGGFTECGNHLSTEQAMSDYASLIAYLRQQYGDASATIVFGGSYGGMLAAWMRMRYPGLVDGAIASSAPIGCLAKDYSGESYWQVVSDDATSLGGAAPNCKINVAQAFQDVFDLAATPTGRDQLTSIFKLCSPLGPSDGEAFALFIQAAFDSMAMGNYPFSTYYISGTPNHPAPAWPMRVACSFMATAGATPVERVTNLYNAIGVVDNITEDVACYNISGLNPSVYSPIWDFMVCTEHIINEQPYFAATGLPNDMFWKQPVYNHSRLNEHCMNAFGKTPRYRFLDEQLGVRNIPASSNIVFANGLLDPWHSGGVLQNLSDSLIALIIPEGAHHLDLFFPTPQDPPSVVEVRAQQLFYMKKWIAEASKAGSQPSSNDKLTTGEMVGIVVASVALAAVVSALVTMQVMRKRQGQEERNLIQ